MSAIAIIRKNAKPIIIMVVVIGLLLILWRNWPQLMRLFKQNHSRGNDQAPLTDGRKAEMETLARRIATDINSSIWRPRDIEAYELAAALNDNELEYLAKFYENTVADGRPLGQDIDDEYMSNTDADERIIARLKTLALY